MEIKKTKFCCIDLYNSFGLEVDYILGNAKYGFL